MSDKLTDAQVAELTGAHDSTVTWESHTFTFTMTGKEPIRRQVRADAVKALALEVQQARQRRCGNCQHFVAESLTAMPTCGNPDKDLGPYFSVTPEWFCADFTPKEER